MTRKDIGHWKKSVISAAIFVMAAPVLSTPVMAAGDLLVAPTRVVLDGQRGTEVILNNIGAEPATYRISLELKRMTADGKLADVSDEDANEMENVARDMIRYAPRRVTLPPNQPQAIRIGIRAPENLADGEYRAHLLFRAVPEAQPAAQVVTQEGGFSIALTPIYGVSIPIIVRQGNLEASASIGNGRVETSSNGKAFVFELSRSGKRSTYGEIRVMKPGESEPALIARGIAVYPEVSSRKVELPLSAEVAAKLTGPVSIEYYEADNAGGGLITKSQLVLK